MNSLKRLLGTWSTEATHPALPGVVVHGTTVIEWLEGERFLIHRSRTDHADFPDAISIIGVMSEDRVDTPGSHSVSTENESLSMHYYDSRGVFRIYQASIDATTWRLWRDAPGFSQRFAGTFGDDDETIAGLWQLSKDEKEWNEDVRITYRRVDGSTSQSSRSQPAQP